MGRPIRPGSALSSLWFAPHRPAPVGAGCAGCSVRTPTCRGGRVRVGAPSWTASWQSEHDLGLAMGQAVADGRSASGASIMNGMANVLTAVASVRTKPGHTVTTLIPSDRRSIRSASGRLIWAALVAPYASDCEFFAARVATNCRVSWGRRVDSQPRCRGSLHWDLALGAPPARAASERVRRQDELRRGNRE